MLVYVKYREFINRIKFRFVRPHTPLLPVGFERFSQKLKFGVKFELFNTHFPRNGRDLRERIESICHIPKMSTCAIGGMINEAVHQMPANQAFVNVGVWNGFSLLSGMVGNADKTCIGVDNFSEFGGPKEDFCERFNEFRSANHHFYEMDYEAYFRQEHNGPIGFYIYDGEHSYTNQLKGLQIAEPYFAEDCLILVDDTNYDEARQGTIDFIENSPNEYEIIFERETFCNSHPTFWNGVMVLRRVV